MIKTSTTKKLARFSNLPFTSLAIMFTIAHHF